MRYWTVAEAREYLPRLRDLVARVRAATVAAARVRGDGQHPPPDVREALDELAAGDIVLRDPQAGLVDFHALGRDGVVYLLCWRLDDPDLAWWHLPEEGFPGRKPLPRDPE